MTSHSVPCPQPAADASHPCWYALYTCPRHEKQVAAYLGRKQVDHFLPLYETVRSWKDRRAHVRLPLFPGYVFVHVSVRDRLQVLNVPGVVRLVASNGRPVPVAEDEIEALRHGLADGLRAEPHPFLRVGRRVRVKNGPLVGMEGLLVRRKQKFRLVLSVDLIMRSVAIEVDVADVEPVQQ